MEVLRGRPERLTEGVEAAMVGEVTAVRRWLLPFVWAAELRQMAQQDIGERQGPLMLS